MLLHDHISRVAKARASRSSATSFATTSSPRATLWGQAIQELEEELHAIDQSIAALELQLRDITNQTVDEPLKQISRSLSVLLHNRRTVVSKISDLSLRRDASSQSAKSA